MGTLADSLFNVLMGWVRALVGSIWALFSSERTTILEFLGQNWAFIALALVAAGLVIDWLIWLLRWQPYHLWAVRARRLLRLPPPEGDEDEEIDEAIRSGKRSQAPARTQALAPEREPGRESRPEESWLPLERPQLDERDERQAFAQAESVPDEELGAYPGMRYGAGAADDLGGTRRYAAVHAEGPGAAEVERRRAEIEAWQEQMREEARQKAEAERAAREAYEAEQARLAQEAYEAEQARLAQEAYEAEQARLAQEAYEAEQARLAQEEYERQLAEYERQKAQYERDLAEYERRKAEYDAEMARQAAEAAPPAGRAQREPEDAPSRRRRAAKAAYSDYVAGEPVTQLPDPPQWPQFAQTQTIPKQEREDEAGARRKTLLSKVAKLVEPEQEEIAGFKALPPRVDRRDAYRAPAKPGKKPGRRKQ